MLVLGLELKRAKLSSSVLVVVMVLVLCSCFVAEFEVRVLVNLAQIMHKNLVLYVGMN